MLSIIKSNSITSLEKQLADKQTKLGQLRTQYGEVRQRADELGDLVAAALVDEASNLQSLEGQLFAAEVSVAVDPSGYCQGRKRGRQP